MEALYDFSLAYLNGQHHYCILGLLLVPFKNVFLSFYVLAMVGLPCCMQALSGCRRLRLLFIVVCGLLLVVASVVECGLFWHMGFGKSRLMGSVVVTSKIKRTDPVVVVQGLGCSVAFGIFPDQGLNPCPLHYKVDS